MTFHEDILDILLDYRKGNPDFNFICRQRNRNNKFEKGLYFQGNESYAFVGIIDRSGGVNMTRSAGLTFSPAGESLHFDFEIVHKGEEDPLLLGFYQELRNAFKGGEEVENNEKYIFKGGKLSKDHSVELYSFLDEYFPRIKTICDNSSLSGLMISDQKFNKIIANVMTFAKQQHYWIFQCNPSIYNIAGALKAGHLKSWKVATHKDAIKKDDKVIIWQTGKKAGCYALAEVASDVSEFDLEEYEKQYYHNPTDVETSDRVKIKIEEYLADDPVLWKDIKDDKAFSQFKAGNQGTNFRATEEEYNAFLTMSSKNMNSELIKKQFSNWLKRNESSNKVNSYLRAIEILNKILVTDLYLEQDIKKLKLLYQDLILEQKNVRGKYYYEDAPSYGNNGFYSASVRAFKDFLKQRIKMNNKGENLFELYRAHLFETRKGDILDSTIESYAETAAMMIPSRWNELYNQSFDFFVIDYPNLKKIVPLLKQGFSGYTSFSPFINSLIDEYKDYIPPINQILYGPPGTGKTYYLKDQLFDKYTSKETSVTQEQHFEGIVSGCSWWQVIAIALLDLGSSKVSDIFEHEWVQKKASLSNSNTVRPTLWGQLQSHTVDVCDYVNVVKRQTPQIFTKTEDSFWEILEDQVAELVPELLDLQDSVDNFNPDPDKIIKHYDFVTFHQSFSYEDFIEGIKPIMPENGEAAEDLGYTIEDGVFKDLCLNAKNDPDNRYAIFIDEINRGNVSAIFGELITLIETDKRKGAKNELDIKLPYSKKEFTVPPNLDIYGTMNTADRSVEALDTALRRRFEFKEMMPDYKVIEEETVENIELSEVLKAINERIELLIDRDHTIGHSYFVNVDTTQKLTNAFNDRIVPLLQEYFYGDYGKIGLVLGKGFVEKIKNDKVNFAAFEYDNANDFKTPTFTIKRVNSDSIIDAVTLLLAKKEPLKVQ